MYSLEAVADRNVRNENKCCDAWALYITKVKGRGQQLVRTKHPLFQFLFFSFLFVCEQQVPENTSRMDAVHDAGSTCRRICLHVFSPSPIEVENSRPLFIFSSSRVLLPLFYFILIYLFILSYFNTLFFLYVQSGQRQLVGA